MHFYDIDGEKKILILYLFTAHLYLLMLKTFKILLIIM